ncbi:hypothetical protein [Pantoea agglomerans]|jgi:hypothetical protein|uniref:hypothetical protein n=1 Tax=Pantoea TaxID=53335 RepID=UPI003C7EBBA3
MSKKTTFTQKNELTKQSLKDWSLIKRCSHSESINFWLDLVSPLIREANYHHQTAAEIERNAVLALKRIMQTDPLETESTRAEVILMTIWDENIRQQEEIVDNDVYIHKLRTQLMGKNELEGIQCRAEEIIERYGAERLIWIYTDRRVNHQHLQAGGISNLIMIKKSHYANYYFDINHAIILSLCEIAMYGADKAIKKKGVILPHSYTCWIPIYHTNNMVVMIPVIEERMKHKSCKENCVLTVINPFNEEVRNI